MRYIIFLLGLLIAFPALATSSLTICSSTGTAEDVSPIVDHNQCVAWRFTAADEDSVGITFNSQVGTICFDPDTASAGVGTSQVMIWHCPTGLKPSSNFDYTCDEILDAPLTGLSGADGTQNRCVDVWGGTFFSEVTTAPDSEASVVYFRAAGD